MSLLEWFNPGRWLMLGGAVLALTLGYFAWADHQQDIGEQRAIDRYTVQAAKAEAAARTREQDLQSIVTKARNDAKLRETKLAADAGRARAAADSLRSDLAAARSHLSGASCQSVRRYAETANTVLGECTATVEGLAGTTQSVASDALMLLDAWPK